MRLPARLLQRKLKADKSAFGHIFILAGSRNLSGAAILASRAAMRSGAGLVTLGVPKSLCAAFTRIKLAEVMLLPLAETSDGCLSFKAYAKISEFIKRAQVLLIGPGLGRNTSTQKLVRKIVSKQPVKMVIDADGLNALVKDTAIFKARNLKTSRQIIITPHEKEMARLLNSSLLDVQKRRKEVAKKFAQYYNITIILKGHKSLVAGPKGEFYVNRTGNPGMATAGSGDVLAGIVSAFLGQGLTEFQAAKYAAYLHGIAGDLAARQMTQVSMIASDIIDQIPRAVKMSS
ncbi:MAG: NAD(P)H-hydrate dehydratase [Candidatus Omnitrophica bacterium]|jgi:NAD(P)H-hydrate epimerase|nr:NAD(P)H-hydrate dehydratase [Candidatus Omnitrophota bacterium]